MIVIAAFYKFTDLDDRGTIRSVLMNLMREVGIKGTIILAREGINGTVAGNRAAIDRLKEFFADDERFLGIEYKESFAETLPFKRTKIHHKPEIVTLGRPDINPNKISGVYVSPQEWNELICNPQVTVLDVRNDFEVKLGTFHNAINPKTSTFRDFTTFVEQNLSPAIHKKIAISCTGGIRCEKASALMKTMGFEEVFHLKGGILAYLKDTPKDKSLWRGECFVFDERVTLDHDLAPVVAD